MNSQSSPQIHFVRGKIVTHQEIAQATWQVEIHSPELAEQFVPGQFAMLKIAGRQDAILDEPSRFGIVHSIELVARTVCSLSIW